MISISLLLSLASLWSLILAQGGNYYRFGPAFSLGPTQSYIVYAETTLYPGKTPQPQLDRLALWAGMGTDAKPSNLIQAIIVSLGSERKYAVRQIPIHVTDSDILIQELQWEAGPVVCLCKRTSRIAAHGKAICGWP
jgi:hypothetical protein